ncbi:MAG: hypothetical protein MZV70_31290 [Desulfobacterales bacterium]|nr:hypothetical protein [Desulfobacterales bacterium]
MVNPYTADGKKGIKIQILDISEGGCPFIYRGTKEELVDSGLLTLMDDESPYLESVDFETVSDNLLLGYFRMAKEEGIEFQVAWGF